MLEYPVLKTSVSISVCLTGVGELPSPLGDSVCGTTAFSDVVVCRVGPVAPPVLRLVTVTSEELVNRGVKKDEALSGTAVSSCGKLVPNV